ncbi:hypothetical protein [Longitalea luteola]|uniref:hypothetical protein n=1 Tax=Longitalea luteola TaxID=2812563 RepID=UPI001A9563FD|nr:hypothetical protein [Longitalea luteola]
MPSAKDQSDFTLKQKLQYAAIGLVLVGGGLYVGHRILRSQAIKRQANKSAKEGTPADFATRIKMAFENNGWWGTDVEALRAIFREIPTKEIFYGVMRSYNTGGKNLMLDLKSELTTTEYNEMLAIAGAKPEKVSTGYTPQIGQAQYQAWAKRLKAAFDYTWGPNLPGTDEDAVRSVFMEIPTQADYAKVAEAYQLLYGQSLKNGLLQELELWEYSPLMAIITNKPKV